MGNIYLVGSEDVRAAGNNISGAADTMTRAAMTIACALEGHETRMTELVERLEYLLENKEKSLNGG